MTDQLTPTAREIIENIPLSGPAREYVTHSRSERTAEAYRGDWKHWQTWCEDHGANALPASEVALANYIADMATGGFKASTIDRRMASIAAAHKAAGIPSATRSELVKRCLAGIYRVHGTAPDNARPLLLEDIKRIADMLDTKRMQDVRDRALILFGWAGALRRSEIAGIRREHLDYRTDGVILTIPRSKTDPTGKGQRIAVPYAKHDPKYCAVLAMGAWLDRMGSPVRGPVFVRLVYSRGKCGDDLSNRRQRATMEAIKAQRVDFIVKECAERAGIDITNISAHSLRAGFATSADEAGVSLRDIRRQTRHSSDKQVESYIRSTRPFRDNAAGAML